jgi:UDP-N-acetylmuramoyl-L-alanyl-D-glutamate--2,6-diaminopimelate ligase
VIGYLLRQPPRLTAKPPVASRRARCNTSAFRRMSPMVLKLSDYLRTDEVLAFKGDLDCAITGLAMDSRRVVLGNVFFALPGLKADGMQFVDESIRGGAAVVIAERLPAFSQARVTFVRVADPRAVLARMAQRFYSFPDQAMGVVGVTGTNGKTTVTHLIQHFLNAGRRVGLIGTINYDLGVRTVPSFRTTPESLDIYGMLAQMRDAGCRHAVMEVSSHGIDQQRVLGLQFAATVFTNLTRDHLDYHETVAAYFDVKSRLFTGEVGPAPKIAVVNLDDPYGEKLAAKLAPRAAGPGATLKLITFGEHPQAMIRAEQAVFHPADATFQLSWPGPAGRSELAVASPLVGRYNLSNVLAAAATVWGLGEDLPDDGQAYRVFVDYAHTDDALRNALGMLRPVTKGRLLVVFGCGGNRDRSKRPHMVQAVQECADFALATADNPRTEPLAQIFSDMQAGVIAPEKIAWIEDRRRAIGVALDAAKPGDCVLIAGKGHESYQEFADTVVPFDDRQVARELIASHTPRPV